jgi:hypothetical protein
MGPAGIARKRVCSMGPARIAWKLVHSMVHPEVFSDAGKIGLIVNNFTKQDE